MTGEESRNVLEEDGGRSVSLHKGKEGEGEAGSGEGARVGRPVIMACAPVPSSVYAIPSSLIPRPFWPLSIARPSWMDKTEAAALAGNAEVLAGEAAGPESSAVV